MRVRLGPLPWKTPLWVTGVCDDCGGTGHGPVCTVCGGSGAILGDSLGTCDVCGGTGAERATGRFGLAGQDGGAG